MRILLVLALALAVYGQKGSEDSKDVTSKDVTTTVQRLFDSMATHDAVSARALFVPGATLTAIRADGKVTTSASEEFAAHVGAATEPWVERIWTPKVTVKGAIDVLWAPYDFHRAGKFSHCGIDLVNLAKQGADWKITSLSYTVETENCEPAPANAGH
jgi:hypothetical protein